MVVVLEQILECLNCQTGVFNNAAHSLRLCGFLFAS